MTIQSPQGPTGRGSTKGSSAAFARTDTVTRIGLAVGIVSLALVGVTVLAGVILVRAPDDQQYQAAQLVLTAVLPLFGTWVGTVLAFYFAKGNLEAATDSTLRLTGQISRDTPVQQVMIQKSAIIARILAANESEASVTIPSLYAQMKSNSKKRIPILQNDIVKWVVHDSLLMAYAAKKNWALEGPEIQAKTLADILAEPDLKGLAKALAFVPVTGTIATARERLQGVPGCNDVFVTKNGNDSEPILGWLTNTMLAAVE